MKAAATYTASGNKATAAAQLPSTIFDVDVPNHTMLQQAYVAYLANGRDNLALAKRRGEVRGGGKKPWKQKGTGRARFGSSRVPIWRGGGVVFGPTGEENYARKMSTVSKRTALRQALTLAARAGKIKVLTGTTPLEGKTKELVSFIDKIEATGRTLVVVEQKDPAHLAARNLLMLDVVSSRYLNVYDVLNADTILIDEKSLTTLKEWLSSSVLSKNANGGKK